MGEGIYAFLNLLVFTYFESKEQNKALMIKNLYKF
jgi:hypothetical protein